jgi:hypothetical protein
MQKLCCWCKQKKKINYFSLNKLHKDGHNDSCRDCTNDYRRKYYIRNKDREKDYAKKWRQGFQDIINEYKLNGRCVKCGENHPATLDFHHTTNEKNFEIANAARIVGITKEKLIEEITKCVILCSNCHRKHHWGLRNRCEQLIARKNSAI